MSKSFREDLTGQRFGRLTVIEFVPDDKNVSSWKCVCKCGNIVTVRQTNLKNGHAQSCGCLKIDSAKSLFTTHGLRNTRLYRIWAHMKGRCHRETDKKYKDYGGRGITVCDEWKNDFKAFHDWAMANGYADELSIDRIDVNGNYEPNNCRWVDMKTQSRNRRSNIIVEYQGKKMCLVEASERTGINVSTLQLRYKNGDRGEYLFRSKKEK